MFNQRIGARLTLAAVTVLFVMTLLPSVHAQDTNTVELIRQLQKRIEELEHKVKVLEEDKTNAPAPASVPAEGIASAPTNQPEPSAAPPLVAPGLNTGAGRGTNGMPAFTDAARVSLGSEGLWVGSANKDFFLELRGLVQVDSRTYLNSPAIAGNDGFLLRRARTIMQGTLYHDFNFMFVPDFAPPTPTIFDALINYNYSPEFQIMAGKFKAPIGLEQLIADRNIIFNERSMATDLVPNRDVGIQLHGRLFDRQLSYAVGVFNGTSDGGNSPNNNFANDIAFMGRLFLMPFVKTPGPLRGLGFGVAGSYESASLASINGLPSNTGGVLPGYYTDGQLQFFAYNPAGGAVVTAQGVHWRVSPQAYYYIGSFGLLGEFVISDQEVRRTLVAPFASAQLQNTAWQIAASYLVTGEKAGYDNVVTPKHPFNPRTGDWGALQLVARYMQLDVDPAAFPLFSNPSTSARSAMAWSVGLTWFLNRNLSMNLDFSHTWFNGGGGPGIVAPATVTRNDENVLFTRIELAF